ncbi:electron transfer flavoprotein subunit alpha [Nitrincola sp. A-D6]|uniref:electron transfer flavoprotein subunit alpha n=1 Tax=Nitrincola sp. A-D6 TaxID=1545442 RepID=UPI00051FE444|nr:electron transfer flavoprotein subunit alpha/FixB family protein [Nitrincola sp. A-D6]KGK41964.1 electron transfer flavoprotein subunit alpha [Nitrincola sp. A-D6]
MSDSLRRDPRREQIRRNRLHPQHDAVLAAMNGTDSPAEWLSAQGIKRRNPHLIGFIGPNGLRRIDRSGVQGGAASAAKSPGLTVDSRPLHHIESPAAYVVVVPDMPGGRLSALDKDLLGLAQQLASRQPETAVLAVVFGSYKELGFADAGVDRLLHLTDAVFEQYSPELQLARLLQLESDLQPEYWLFPDSGLGGGDLGRRFAVQIDVRAATGLWQVRQDNEQLQCICRGAAATVDITRELPRVVLALPECAEPVSDTRHEAVAFSLRAGQVESLQRIEDMGAVGVDPASVSLAEAEFILSGGNGVTDWQGFHTAAEVLGATEGASRVAVDDGFMPRDRQVGATGTWVTARVYLAVGISGAIQHLQGIQTCEKVIAINTDPGCDMVKRADLAVIGDAAAILEKLIEKVNALKQETRHVA